MEDEKLKLEENDLTKADGVLKPEENDSQLEEKSLTPGENDIQFEEESIGAEEKTYNFDCKAFLKLKIPKPWYNIMGLSWERYELVACDYHFHKGMNRNGEVCTGLKGGLFTATVTGTPSEALLAWMFDHTKKFNGEVTVMDLYEETIEQIYFEQARLTGLSLNYKAVNTPNTVTTLTMVVDSLQIGDAYFENLNQ